MGIFMMIFRGGGLISDEEEDDGDSVELEKSNVLLLGPTGSGEIISIAMVWWL
jgi:ATP-dependent protease Clp ATPase subunit